MNYVDWTEILKLAVKEKGMCGVYISNNLNFDEHDIHIWEFVQGELKKLYEEPKTYIMCIGDLIHGGLFFFDTEIERDTFYAIFQAPLTDSSAIYACTYDASGDCITENT